LTQRCRLAMLLRQASRAARRAPRRLSTAPATPEKGWPWYLKAMGASAACAGTGAYVALLMHHELGFRRFCEGVAPSLVDLVRQRYPFADEDSERRAYVQKLTEELATPRTVSFEGRRVEVAGGASASECREALGIACDLDIDIEDVEGVDEVMVAEEVRRLKLRSSKHGSARSATTSPPVL
jgi:hypothetical protein